jgi:hypothetical protein
VDLAGHATGLRHAVREYLAALDEWRGQGNRGVWHSAAEAHVRRARDERQRARLAAALEGLRAALGEGG